MLVLLLATSLAWRAGALPTSSGPPALPTTLAHSIVYGMSAHNSCSDVRSMYDIIRTCFLTIGACVYRAIHPNIPDPNASFWKGLMIKIKIVLYALISPELMIFWAIRQRMGANVVAEEVNKVKPELRWTQVHGHFAQMGGFGRKDTKHILYPPTLIELLKTGQLDIEELQLTKKEINDKSKGDMLSKGVVAFQTTWFVFECITRLQQGLPIVELEVVTLAFATLNLITYAFWWYKPLNVMCPIYLHIQPPPSRPAIDSKPSSSNLDSPVAKKEKDDGNRMDGAESSGILSKAKAMIRGVVRSFRDGVKATTHSFKKDARDNGWWRTLWKWLIEDPFIAIAKPLGSLWGDESTDDSASYVSIFYGMEISQEKENRVIFLSSFIGMVFGAMHFISWDSAFRTHTQLLLWRTSSVIMVVQPFLIFMAKCFGVIYQRAPSGSRREKIFDFLATSVSYISFIGGPIPYIFARLCVLVLAFLTLRDLPPEAFRTISWTSYIPHF